MPPLLDCTDQRLRRHRIGRVDREALGDRHEWLHPPFLRDICINREDRLVRQERRQDQSIQERDVVGDDHGSVTQALQMLEAARLDPETQFQQACEECLDQGVRKKPADIDRHDAVDDADGQEDARHAHPRRQQPGRPESPGDHEQRVDDIVAGNGS